MAGVVFVQSQESINWNILNDPKALQRQALRRLYERCRGRSYFRREDCPEGISSSVMLLLGMQPSENGQAPEVCVILNKRSARVRQPGDLCCPGGTVEAHVDPYLARLLEFPPFPLALWPHWRELRRRHPDEARVMSLLLATGLRESWEEMRLNPFCARFLGPLPSQCLVLFNRIIYPMVAWVSFQTCFAPSWEVESIVRVPLRAFLDPASYARYRLYVPPRLRDRFREGTRDFPCFIFPMKERTEVLWGVTFRIVALFIELLFGFRPPDTAGLPLVTGVLDEAYLVGRT